MTSLFRKEVLENLAKQDSDSLLETAVPSWYFVIIFLIIAFVSVFVLI